MKPEITEQERQAIEEAANKSIIGYPDWTIQEQLDTLRSEFKAGAEFALSELHKPSEDLVHEILKILDNISGDDDSGAEFLLGGDFEKAAIEIAKLLSSCRCQQNDVNTELLEALKRLIFLCETNKMAAESEIWMQRIGFAKEAITNAEKQIKP